MLHKLFHFDKEHPRTPWIFYIFYFVVFCGGAVQGSFLSLYLKDVGVPTASISLLNGILQILSLIFLPIIGRIADRASSKNIVMTIGYVITIISLFLFTRIQNVLLICILRIMYGLIATPIMSVYETIAMDSAHKNGWEYQPIRMSGTIGYSIMAFVSGFILSGNVKTIFPVMIVCYTATLVIGLLLPTSANVLSPTSAIAVNNQAEKAKSGSVYSLLKNRVIRNVLIMFFIFSLCSSANNNFFSLYAQELGGDLKMVGIAFAILGFSELPFHLGPGKRWLQRIGVEKSMIVVLAVGTFRWLICGITNNATVLMWTMILNGIMLVPVIIGVAQFLYNEAPDGLKVSAQTSLRSSVSVAAMLISDFGGSALISFFTNKGLIPYKYIYLIQVPLCAIGIIIGWASIKKAEKEKSITTPVA